VAKGPAGAAGVRTSAEAGDAVEPQPHLVEGAQNLMPAGGAGVAGTVQYLVCTPFINARRLYVKRLLRDWARQQELRDGDYRLRSHAMVCRSGGGFEICLVDCQPSGE
jgi:hypothetical protein